MISDILFFSAYHLDYKIVHKRNMYYLYLIGALEDTLITKCWHSSDILQAAFRVQGGELPDDDDVTEELEPRDITLVPPSDYSFDSAFPAGLEEFPEPETELSGHCAPSPWLSCEIKI